MSLFALSPWAPAALKWLQSQKNSSVVGEETWAESNPASSCHLSFIYSYRWSIQVESVIFLLLADRDKQIVVIWLPWQLLAQELQWRFLQWSRRHRDESLTVSVDKYRHILWFCSRKSVRENTAATLADEWKSTDEGWPNVSYTLQICSSCSSSAAASEVIGPKCSPQLTYGNGKHMRNEGPAVKGLMAPSNGMAYRIWVLFDMAPKAKKMNEFYVDSGWIRWGIWGSASLLKWNSK